MSTGLFEWSWLKSFDVSYLFAIVEGVPISDQRVIPCITGPDSCTEWSLDVTDAGAMGIKTDQEMTVGWFGFSAFIMFYLLPWKFGLKNLNIHSSNFEFGVKSCARQRRLRSAQPTGGGRSCSCSVLVEQDAVQQTLPRRNDSHRS